MFKKAIELDPGYAPSYAALADLYNSYYNTRVLTQEEKEKYIRLQEKYIKDAFKINPNSAYINGILGYVQAAKGEIEKSFESNKSSRDRI